jgi:hypothetical protein
MKGVRRTNVQYLKAMNFSFDHFTGLAFTSSKTALYRYFDFGLVVEGDELVVLTSADMKNCTQ